MARYYLYKDEVKKIGPFTSKKELLSQLKLITCRSFAKALTTGGWSIRNK